MNEKSEPNPLILNLKKLIMMDIYLNTTKNKFFFQSPRISPVLNTFCEDFTETSFFVFFLSLKLKKHKKNNLMTHKQGIQTQFNDIKSKLFGYSTSLTFAFTSCLVLKKNDDAIQFSPIFFIFKNFLWRLYIQNFEFIGTLLQELKGCGTKNLPPGLINPPRVQCKQG